MSTVSAEKPLAGAVLCCTSVSPELRTQYAEYAQQMGAEHKLDLTSDVTHLLVGDTDTLKYRYVAREREDVKVLRPEFVDAVRGRWMQAQSLSVEAVEEEYRLAPFHGLKICITGFDDMNFRTQLQQNVLENGGHYSGDLTKEVTHLVAARPEGKKYEYATQWQKKVVSLKWYKDTLSRGMQLDESLYHPSKPIDEQGIGAWNHRPQLQSQLGKRAREEPLAAGPPKKLRRTASSRLSSQNDNMWTDIVGGGAFTAETNAKPPLRPSKSMPALDGNPISELGLSAPLVIRHGYFHNKCFAIQGFDSIKQGKLRSIIVDNGGVVVDSLHDLRELDSAAVEARLLFVPWQTPREHISTIANLNVVSELWLEYCMERKTYVPPPDYVYGSLLSQVQPTGFSKLTITSSGFPGIQVLHTSKIVKALGAKYSEVLNQRVSVLVCKTGPDNPQRKAKMQCAQAWGIPVVSEKWLYSCMQNNRKQPFEAYLLQRPRVIVEPEETANSAKERRAEVSDLQRHHEPHCTNDFVRVQDRDKSYAMDEGANEHRKTEQQRPGSDFRPTANTKTKQQVKPAEDRIQDAAKRAGEGPLKELSPNSPTKQPDPDEVTKPKKQLFKTLDGSNSFTDENQPVPNPAPSMQDSATVPPAPTITNAHTLNGEIQDLLNIKAKAKATANATSNQSKKLIGRALSNLSNASATSQRKLSRASSVDSMNTDGIGSEIGPVSGKSQEMGVSGPPRSFTGRAKSRLLDGVSNSIELIGNPALSIEDLPQQEDQTPALTQLVYDDSEEAVMLREKLAAKRRARSRFGQKEDDPKPEKPREQQQRRIKDDDILVNAGWAGAGRTRRGGKVPTPEEMKGF